MAESFPSQTRRTFSAIGGNPSLRECPPLHPGDVQQGSFELRVRLLHHNHDSAVAKHRSLLAFRRCSPILGSSCTPGRLGPAARSRPCRHPIQYMQPQCMVTAAHIDLRPVRRDHSGSGPLAGEWLNCCHRNPRLLHGDVQALQQLLGRGIRVDGRDASGGASRPEK